MAHGYRILQHWNQWLTQQFLGNVLLETEAQQLKILLERHFGKHAILIGVPNQYGLLEATKIPCHSLVSPLLNKDQRHRHGYIEGDLHDLPILTGSVDLVILPHTLELIDNPRQLLAEACRIIKPEGLIVISGFNPFSVWGLRKLFSKKNMPWSVNFIHSHKVKSWLKLHDFALEKHGSALFTPPINQAKLYRQLHFFERIGSKCFPMLGSSYLIVARAKVVPLTPIRLKWKQHLGGLRIPATFSGHTAR